MPAWGVRCATVIPFAPYGSAIIDWTQKTLHPKKGRGAGSQHRRGSQNQLEDLSEADDLFGEIITRAGV